MISKIAGYKGEIKWDDNKPDGAINKLLDNSVMKKIGWEPKYDLEESLRKTYEYYQRGENVRQ